MSDGGGLNPGTNGGTTFPLPVWAGLRQVLGLWFGGVGSMVKFTLTEHLIGTMFSVKWV
jgi:hypothetical protein